MGPIDYSIDVANPFESAMKGYAGGIGIQQQQMQQQIAQQQMQVQHQVIRSLISNPNAGAQDYANATLLVPGMREQFKQAWDTKNADQQKNQLTNLSQWSSALQNGKPDIAVADMNKQADAMEATAGQPTHESQALRAQASVIEAHPEFGKFMINSLLVSHPDGGKVVDAITKQNTDQRAQQQAPADLLQKQAAASKAATEAGVAAATVPAQIEKPVLQNQETAQNIEASKTKQKVDQYNADISAADSETKRGQLVLERDKYIAEQKLKTQGVSLDAQNQMDTIGQSIETVKSLMKHPGLDSGTGTGGDFRAWFNGTDARDFRSMADTLKSQQFLTQAKEMKGMGALSDAEGARIERAIASLDTSQSTKQYKNALGVILTTLEKGQSKLVAGGKLPTAGGSFVMSHPELGKVNEGDINRLLAKNPGATRDQVMQYLNSAASQPYSQIPK